ncbi:BQ5605_C034g11330 [Microbotryum silenes-dioicae]|uniref:BQ5605_C034g11330 protein n=1 Tax=Microbotryum silenes-dioicae TaxID=796604 RepID=A0A2X0MJE4_9BASI|nr:BQ5605_C034g11330 [Microbotryum silenes-dioicae]
MLQASSWPSPPRREAEAHCAPVSCSSGQTSGQGGVYTFKVDRSNFGGLFEGAENIPASYRRCETTSSHSNPAGATFARISSAATALEEADPHRLLTVGTSKPRVIREWIARFKRFGTRSTLHAFYLEDILSMHKFTGSGSRRYAVDPRRRCPTNAEI